MLHLGCGAGGNDNSFKKHFNVTGVDISEDMLAIARKVNPEIEYINCDMKKLALEEYFDAVAIPDSIGYMTTEEDLDNVISVAYKHLKPGGVLFIAALVREDFRDNNFVYTGSRGGIEITLFENNSIPDPAEETYEVTLVYLIRNNGKLEIHTDTDKIGLFSLSTWYRLLEGGGFEVNQMKLENSYDRYLMEEGEYTLRMFVCSKP